MSNDTNRTAKPRSLVGSVVILGWGLLVAALAWPLFTMRSHPSHGRAGACRNNLKQIGIALQNYHERYRTLPPAYVAGPDDKPMHSWRVLLLPFLEETGAKSLYEQYDFSEPWNGPHNSKLAGTVVSVFVCPSTDSDLNETNYLAVVGPATAWLGAKAVRMRDIRDGTSKTILIVEVANSGIHWMEPRDLSLEQALQGVNAKSSGPCISSRHPGGAMVTYADSHVTFLPDDIPKETLRALLTIAGGEDVREPD